MRALAANFVKGLFVLLPIIFTAYLVYFVLSTLDNFFPAGYPGLGLAISVLLITLVGFLTSNVVGERVMAWVEQWIIRVPFVRILYTSIKDLMGAFVGDKKSFDKPVMVEVSSDGAVKVLGFVTCERFDDIRFAGHVSVYLPQSYNFAGNLIIVPKERVHPVDADGAQFLAFVLSGGVADMKGARTVLDPSATVR